MQIIWYGHSFFQILTQKSKKKTIKIAIDPFDEKIGLKPPLVEADILLITHSHPDHNNAQTVKDSPFLISGPGEYEIGGVFIKGVPAFHDDEGGKERGEVTIYTIESEDLKICHLSDFGQKELTEEQLESIGDIDILMIPIGGVYTISAKEAAKIVSQIEPKIVIPMHYQIPKLKIHPVKSRETGISSKMKSFNGVKLEGVEGFLRAMGVKSPEVLKKFSIQEKSLPAEGTKIIIMKP